MKTMNKDAFPDDLDRAVKRTNWCVFTGAPCSGKSSVIDGLADRGHPVVPEAARAFIDNRLAQGYTLSEAKADILAFERHILYEKVRIENDLSADRMVFLDRAVPDSIAYFQLEGLDIAEPLKLSRAVRYAKVFLFDRLMFAKDAVRSETHSLAVRIESLLADSYAMLGYDIIRVPLMSIAQRIEFVLNHCDPSTG